MKKDISKILEKGEMTPKQRVMINVADVISKQKHGN